MRYVLHPDAFEDIQNAVDFYDGNVAGLGVITIISVSHQAREPLQWLDRVK